MRRLGPDQLRGLLLGIVIFGHTIAATVPNDLTKWMIYSFHMPLFLALSGSLINLEKLRERSVSALLSHYARRMGWQWIVATLLFMGVLGRWPLNWQQWISRGVTDPYFHLWFVPALMFMVMLTWVIVRAGKGLRTMLGIGVVGWVLFDAMQIQYDYAVFRADHVDYRFIGFYLWFVLGIAARSAWMLRIGRWAYALVALGLVGVWLSFGDVGSLRDLSVLMLNVGLIALLPSMFVWLERPVVGIGGALRIVGQYSLWIYLLHPLVTALLKDNPDSQYSNAVGGLALTAAILGVSAGCGWLFERVTTSRRASA